MKQASLLRLGTLTLFVFWGMPGLAQGKDDPAQLKAQIDQLTKEQMDIALTIQQASPDIQQGSSPQTTSRLAGATLKADFESNKVQRQVVISKCNGQVPPEELAAAQSACAAVRIPYNKRLDELKVRNQQLDHLDQLSDQIQGLRKKLAGIRGVQCSECGTDDDGCWRRCFDGSRNHDGAVTVAVGSDFSTQAKAERDRKAIEAYLNSGAIPTTGVKVWTKPPPSPSQ